MTLKLHNSIPKDSYTKQLWTLIRPLRCRGPPVRALCQDQDQSLSTWREGMNQKEWMAPLLQSFHYPSAILMSNIFNAAQYSAAIFGDEDCCLGIENTFELTVGVVNDEVREPNTLHLLRAKRVELRRRPEVDVAQTAVVPLQPQRELALVGRCYGIEGCQWVNPHGDRDEDSLRLSLWIWS